jgi:hypothetical protein
MHPAAEMTSVEYAAVMREVVFAGHSVAFTPVQTERHMFDIRLICALCIALNISETSAQHVMMLWTISLSMSARGGAIDVCVACLMVCAKMYETIAGFGLKRFAEECANLFQSRDHTARALENTLQHGADVFQKRVHYLTLVLKMFDSTELVREVANVSAMHLKYAEIFLLFTSFNDQWYHYLIELHEYVQSKTHGMTSTLRMDIILQVCGVENT